MVDDPAALALWIHEDDGLRVAAQRRRMERCSGGGLHRHHQVDFDHDGLLDLFQSCGRVTRDTTSAWADPYAERNLLFRGLPDQRFGEVDPAGGTATDLIASSRGTAFGDIDNDGDLDVLIVNRNGQAHLLRNVIGDASTSIVLNVVGESGLPDLAAVVDGRLGDRIIHRRVAATYSYNASNDPRIHIGMGNAPEITDLVVRWSDGEIETFGSVGAGEHRTLRRGEGVLQ